MPIISGSTIIRGSKGTPIAQDDDDNLIAVMKGNYEGVLKTWKVDTDGRGEMFLSDPIDVWGNIIPMGLAEHAVRAHAPPIVFDRRGSILRWIDFESATPKYEITASGGTVTTRTNENSANGSFSMLCYLGFYDGIRLHASTNDFHLSQMGVSAMFSINSTNIVLGVQLSYFDGVYYHKGILYVDPLSGNISIETFGTNPIIGSTTFYVNVKSFSTIKLVVDLNTNKYVRAIVFGQEFDISTYNMLANLDASVEHVEFSSLTQSQVCGGKVYVDNIILTENEP